MAKLKTEGRKNRKFNHWSQEDTIMRTLFQFSHLIIFTKGKSSRYILGKSSNVSTQAMFVPPCHVSAVRAPLAHFSDPLAPPSQSIHPQTAGESRLLHSGPSSVFGSVFHILISWIELPRTLLPGI